MLRKSCFNRRLDGVQRVLARLFLAVAACFKELHVAILFLNVPLEPANTAAQELQAGLQIRGSSSIDLSALQRVVMNRSVKRAGPDA
jgi:hypothetical protein